MSQPDTNRNLLFAIMAVQMDFVPRENIVSTVLAWIENKDVPLGQVLVNRGELSPVRRNLLDQLLDEHIKAHAGDPARSLQALSSTDGVADLLTRVPDDDLQASLGHLRDRGRTLADSDDIPTSAPTPGDLPTQAPADGGQGGSWTTPLAPWGNRFRVVRKHAEGGLGVVSVAIDDELDREVAYKEIKPRHADRRDSQARFVMEAEITGKLEHPGIVPIYGLGHDPQGRPYYAMRFIQGDSLAEAINRFHDPAGPYADPGKRTLQLRELLGRFLDVCDALAYAHSRGVLHRDLKPGNVMLGPFGETLVVDWGLALNLKEIPSDLESTHALLKTSKADTDSLPSEQGSIVGTLQYMPPEQAEGAIDQLGPRSDVYGLGAILYDLLTGRHPVTGTTQQELIDAVRAGNLTPPRQLRPDIPRPLEAICLKALSLRPDDRYATPRALASDIKSYLADEPVTAYREPLPDRLRRWSRRHRVLVSTLAATLIVGVIGLGSTLAVLSQSNQKLSLKNEELFEANEEAIDAVKKFGDTIANEPLLKKSTELKDLRKKLLQEPHAFFKTLRQRLQAENDNRPESLIRLADAAYALGYLTDEIDESRDAIAAFQEAQSTYKFLADQNPADTRFKNHLASTYHSMGHVLSKTGRPADAIHSFEQAREIQKTLANQNPSVPEFQNQLAITYNSIGTLLSSTARPDDAMKSYEQAREIQKTLANQNPSVAEFQYNLALSYMNIGLLLMDKGNAIDALKSYEQAREIQRRLATQNPSVFKYQSNLALNDNAIGSLLNKTGRAEDALRSYEQAMAIQKTLAIQNPTVSELQHNLAGTYSTIGTLLTSMGKFKDAHKSYEQAKEIQSTLANQNPSVTDYQSNLATTYNNIGALLNKTDDLTEAINSHVRAKDIQVRLVSQSPSFKEFRSDLAWTYNCIGRIQHEMGKLDDALKSSEEAKAIRETLASENPSIPEFQFELAGSCNTIGNILRAAGRLDDALNSYVHAREIQKTLAEQNPSITKYQSDLANSYHNIGNVLRARGKLDDAHKSYDQAMNIYKHLTSSQPEIEEYPAKLSGTLNNLAKIEFDSKRLLESREHLREAISWQKKALNLVPGHPEYVQSMKRLLTNMKGLCQLLNDKNGMSEAEREIKSLADSDPALIALDARLAAIRQGKADRTNTSEYIQLAKRAYDRSLYSLATQLWIETFTADPRLAEDRSTQLPYNAACAAALAGTGQGLDDPAPKQEEKVRLRGKALGWLRAELKAWEGVLGSAKTEAKEIVRKTLEHWKADPDLAGVREEKALAKLPEAERREWVKLWGEVEGLLKRAR